MAKAGRADCDVIIAGGGMVGLACALALAGRPGEGLAVQVLEAGGLMRPEPPEDAQPPAFEEEQSGDDGHRG